MPTTTSSTAAMTTTSCRAATATTSCSARPATTSSSARMAMTSCRAATATTVSTAATATTRSTAATATISCRAATGADVLTGGSDFDVLTGGAGADIFAFQSASDGPDEITDFVSGTDTIQRLGERLRRRPDRRRHGFAGLGVGPDRIGCDRANSSSIPMTGACSGTPTEREAATRCSSRRSAISRRSRLRTSP